MAEQSERIELSGLSHRLLFWPGPTHGPVALLLHGWLDQADSMRGIATRLSQHANVLALDFRGHGHSDWIGAGGYYHFFDYLRDVAEFLEKDERLAKEPIWLVGHSMGGAVSSLVAGSCPTKIRGLALLEGSGPPAHPASAALRRSGQWLSDLKRFGQGPKYHASLDAMQQRIAALYPEFAPELVFAFTQAAAVQEPGKGWRWRYDPLHRCTNPSPFQQDIYVAFAGAYAGPVLQIFGSESPLARRDDPKVLAREAAFPGPKQVVEIPQARHMMHLTHPEQCVQALLAFWHASA